MSSEQVRIPDIGDASEVEVIELCVSVGDSVEVDDALIVIESDKASMEVPSPVAGRVTALKVAVGDQCSEGDVIAEVELADGQAEEDGDSEANGGAAHGDDGDEDSGKAQEPDATAEEDDAEAEVQTDAASPESSRIEEVRVPDVGDAGEVIVVEVMVAVGDSVEVDDGLVALESDKATMEVPATVAGKVVSIEIGEGDQVTDGTLVARIETRAQGADDGSAARDSRGSADQQDKRKAGRDERDEAAPSPEPAPAPAEDNRQQAADDTEAASAPAGSGADVYAGPAVRMLARELGVQLQQVQGSGNKGRILKEDVHAFVKQRLQGGGGAEAAAGGAIPAIPEVDFSRFGEVDVQPVSRIMRAGAANLTRSWLNLPHVTQHDEADVTDLETFRKGLKADAERAGVKVTPLPLIMKAVQAALAEFPRFNGSFSADGQQYVFKQYFHIGFAVDTPEGLLVPVIRDVDRKGVFELAAEIAELSERAREMKLKPDEMRGGCFSISSLGAIGGTGFTPIVNAPEVAILGVSRLTRKPVWDGEQFVPRDMLPLSLSYDHRAINGAEAGRFMVWLCQALSDLRRILL